VIGSQNKTDPQIACRRRNICREGLQVVRDWCMKHMVMVIDISHPIQSLFTSEEGISRHGPRLALHLTARIRVFSSSLFPRLRIAPGKHVSTVIIGDNRTDIINEHGYHLLSDQVKIRVRLTGLPMRSDPAPLAIPFNNRPIPSTSSSPRRSIIWSDSVTTSCCAA